MQGPPEGFRPKKAGDRNMAGTGEQPEIRDWQRNTWYGPSPADPTPFDEPDDAPELRESRSENVNEHKGAFWAQDVEKGYTFVKQKPLRSKGGSQSAARKRQRPERKPIKIKHLGMKITAIAAAVLILTGFGLRYLVFNISQIDVVTGRNLSDEAKREIIRISGIRMGDNILTLNSDEVEKRIVSDWRLQFRYVEKELPHRVILNVKEREASCWLTWCGIMYVLDKNLMVLGETEQYNSPAAQGGTDEKLVTVYGKNLQQIRDELVQVTGISSIQAGNRTGQTMVFASAEQEAVFKNLFLEMKVLGCTELIQEADLRDLNSLLLVTRTGYTVGLGNAQDIHAKLRSMLLVQNELIRQGMVGGTIHVNNPETPSWSPPGT